MADQTSTLTVGVRTDQALKNLEHLKLALLGVSRAAAGLTAAGGARPLDIVTQRQATEIREVSDSVEDLGKKVQTLSSRYKVAADAAAASHRRMNADLLKSRAEQAQIEEKSARERVSLIQKANAEQLTAAAATHKRLNDQLVAARAKQVTIERAAAQERLSIVKRANAEHIAAGAATHRRLQEQLVAQREAERAGGEAGLAARRRTFESQKQMAQRYHQMDLAARVRHLQQVARLIEYENSLPAVARMSTTQMARNVGMASMRALPQLPRMEAELAALAAGHAKLTTTIPNSTAALKANSGAMREAHGLARGLSGSLGALWTTYGAIMPLLAGAALGTVAKNIYQVGKDIEYRLKFVEALGNASVNMDDMMPAVKGSMKTPLEAAEAMQALAQAGMDTKDSLIALNTVTALSTLGELEMADAAVTVTAALSAFGLAVTDAARVGDVFAKTASVSTTTVPQLAIAMRQASTNAAQFNITLEETSAALAMMAERGIRGTLAGTAFRNMTKELYTPIARGSKALKELGVSAYNSTGSLRPFQDVLLDLRDALSGLNEESKNSALEAIFGERGSRAIKPILADLEAYLGKVKEIEGATGFLALANSKLITTVEGSANRLASTLQQSYVKAFDTVRDQLRNFILTLDEAAASDGFVNFITGFAEGLTTLTRALVSSTEVLSKFLLGYAALKTAMTASQMLWSTGAGLRKTYQAITVQLTASTVTETAAVNANTAAHVQNATAMRGSGSAQMLRSTQAANAMGAATKSSAALVSVGAVLGTVLTRMNVILGLGATAYLAYQYAVTRTREKSEELRDQQLGDLKVIEAVVAGLQTELELITKANLARMGGRENEATLSTLEDIAKVSEQETRRRERSLVQVQAELAGIELQLEGAKKLRLEALRKNAFSQEALGLENQINELKTRQIHLLGEQANLQDGILRSQQAQITAQETLNQLIAQNRLSTSFTGFEGSVAGIEQVQREFKSLQLTIERSKVPKLVEDAKRLTDEMRTGPGSELLDVDTDKLRAVATASIKDVGTDISKGLELIGEHYKGKLFELKENLDQARKAVDFSGASTPKTPKVTLDRDDPNRILDRMNAAAFKEQIQLVGKLEQVELNYLQNVTSELEKRNEAYLPKSVVVGLQAREKAEKSYEALLRKQRQTINDLNEAKKKATDPKILEKTEVLLKKSTRDLAEVLVMQKQAGEAAFDLAKQQYFDENTFSESMKRVFIEMGNEADEFGKNLAGVFSNAVDNFSNAFTDFLLTGKMSFKDLVRSFTRDLVALLSRRFVLNLVGNFGVVGAGGAAAGAGILDTLFGSSDKKGGSIAGMAQNANSLNSIYGTVNQAITGASVGASPTSLAYANTVGLFGGDSIGALYTANGGWAGVGSGAASSSLPATASWAGEAAGLVSAATSTGILSGAIAAGPALTASLSAGTAASVLGGAGSMVTTGASYAIGGGAAAAGGGAAAGGLGGAMGAISTAAPYVGIALAAISLLSGGAFKGETRHGGIYDWKEGQDSAARDSGWSRGNPGEEANSAVSGMLNQAVGTINKAFEGIGSDVGLTYFMGWAESSEKDRGGTASGGTLRIGDQLIDFGTRKKGEGHGGKSGDLNKMIGNLAVDLEQTIIQAWQAGIEEFPTTIQDMIRDIDADALSSEQAQAVVGNVINTIEQVNHLSEAFNNLPLKNLHDLSFEATAALLQFSGGVEAFTNSLNTYYQLFYTEAERAAKVQDQLTDVFSEFGEALPQTNDEFRKLVESLDVTTEAGAALFAMMIRVAPEFHQMTDALGRAGEELARLESERLDQARDNLESAYNNVIRIGEAQIKKLEESFGATDSAMNAYRTAVNSLEREFENLFRTIDDAIRSLRNNVISTAEMAYQQARGVISTAIVTGQIPSTADLTEAVRVAQQGVQDNVYSSQFEQDRANLVLANELEQLQDIAVPQLDTAKATLETLENQYHLLRGTNRISSDSLSVLEAQLRSAFVEEANARTQISLIEAQLAQATQQYNAILGISDINEHGFASLEAALQNFQQAASAARAAGAGGSGAQPWDAQTYLANNPDVNAAYDKGDGGDLSREEFARHHLAVYGQFEGRPSTPATSGGGGSTGSQATDYLLNNPDVAAQYNQHGAGMSLEAYVKHHYDNYGKHEGRAFRKGGFASPGWAMVGEEGPELVNFSQPGRVYTADQTRNMLSGGGNTREVVAELRQLREDNRKMTAYLYQITKETKRTALNTEDTATAVGAHGQSEGAVVVY